MQTKKSKIHCFIPAIALANLHDPYILVVFGKHNYTLIAYISCHTPAYLIFLYKFVFCVFLFCYQFLVNKRCVKVASSLAIAERPRCMVGEFWPKVEDWNWETILCDATFYQ